MPTLEYSAILGELEKKIYRPVYFLTGEEPYFIDEIEDYVEEHVLDDSGKEFNQTVLYGKETDVHTVIEYAKRYPMMSNYQVVIIREAQDMKDIKGLEAYVKAPLRSTILVMSYKYKKMDKRTGFVRAIMKNGVFFESRRIYDHKVPSWVSGEVKRRGYEITPKASLLLSEHVGADLSRMKNEIEKALINLRSGSIIDDRVIEENIGISKDYNIFEFQKAIGSKDVLKANRIAGYFAANEKEHPVFLIIGSLNAFFMRVLKCLYLRGKRDQKEIASILGVHSFFVREYQLAARNYNYAKLKKIFDLLYEYDLRSKGVNNASTTYGELLKELVYKILH
ncbi:MAG: DNA polymerase III subunit delta [Bacteroidales bacterium]